MERKLAAIFYADVAGYSRLTGADEEGTHRTLRAFLDSLSAAIDTHGGRVVHYAGDAILADFPSVIDALTCAAAAQREFRSRNDLLIDDRKLQFRIGINLGDVIIDGEEIYGDGVNVAARLESLAEAGGICISRAVYDQVKGKVTLGFEFMGEQKVKNIAEPVRAYRVLLDGAQETMETKVAPRRGRPVAGAAIIAVGLFFMLAVGAGLWWTGREAPPPVPEAARPAPSSEKPSISVLPFTNMSGYKEQEYFSDGMTEDLITDLSKVSGLFVIARNSTFAYKGQSVDVRQVAKELGVRYVLEGSVRKSGGKVRINAQLIDAATGGHVWADRYDGSLEDVFALQDKVTAKIVASLSIKLTEPEQRRLVQKGTRNIEAYDLYLRGLAQETVFTRRDTAEAIRFYEQAVAVDADYSDAYARMANLYQLSAIFGWTDDKTGALAKAVGLAEKAIALDDQNPFAHWTLGRIVSRRNMAQYGGFERGLKAMERAIVLDPNYAAAHAFLTFFYAGVGRIEDARRSIKTAIRLNPRHPFWYYQAVGVTQFWASDFDAAVASMEKALERNPAAIFVRWWLAAAYAQAGRQDDADWQMEEVRAMDVLVTAEDIVDQTTVHGPAQVKLFTEGLLKAGFESRQ